MTTKHTPGPLSVSFGTKWPFEILIINESGSVIYRESLPCHSSKDNNFEEALNCLNFQASERMEYAAINHRAVADAYLKAAAPDLLEALQELCEIVEDAIEQKSAKDLDSFTLQPARAAIARATGEHP